MMNRPDSCLCSTDRLHRFYALGNNSALDIIYTDHHHSQGEEWDGQQSQQQQHLHVLHSSHTQSGYSSAFEDVLVGDYPNRQKNYLSAW